VNRLEFSTIPNGAVHRGPIATRSTFERCLAECNDSTSSAALARLGAYVPAAPDHGWNLGTAPWAAATRTRSPDGLFPDGSTPADAVLDRAGLSWPPTVADAGPDDPAPVHPGAAALALRGRSILWFDGAAAALPGAARLADDLTTVTGTHTTVALGVAGAGAAPLARRLTTDLVIVADGPVHLASLTGGWAADLERGDLAALPAGIDLVTTAPGRAWVEIAQVAMPRALRDDHIVNRAARQSVVRAPLPWSFAPDATTADREHEQALAAAFDRLDLARLEDEARWAWRSRRTSHRRVAAAEVDRLLAGDATPTLVVPAGWSVVDGAPGPEPARGVVRIAGGGWMIEGPEDEVASLVTEVDLSPALGALVVTGLLGIADDRADS
jgi:hypothetical protein